MPNWASCDLWISGPKDIRTAFINGLTPEEGDDMSILKSYNPCPKDLLETEATSFGRGNEDLPEAKELKTREEYNLEKYGAANWYHWCNSHWGTKWGDCETKVVRNTNNAFITFQSAWGPPTVGLEAVSKKFPDLTFKLKYYERGMSFQGTWICKNGAVLLDENKPYSGHRGG